jgi:hypothetical protein
VKKFLPVVVAIAVAYIVTGQNALEEGFQPDEKTRQDTPVEIRKEVPGETITLVDGEQAKGQGTVIRILADDNNGSRHQRFILELAGGRTLLVAHNIDLAPRIASIKPGDAVEFFGEFESNPQGGVIHWTHHDPNGNHVDGWLRHQGRTYQ